MPTPVSRMRTTASLDCWSAVNQMCPPRGVNFTALCRTLAKTWTSRAPSPLTRIGSEGGGASSVWPAADGERHDGLGGGRHEAGEVERFATQLDFVGGDPGHVEEVIDEAHELPDLTVDHLTGMCGSGRRGLGLQRLEREPYRRQRVPELVRERREELVLALIGFGQLGRAIPDPQLEVPVQRLRVVLGGLETLDQILVVESQPERGFNRKMEYVENTYTGTLHSFNVDGIEWRASAWK